MSRSFFQRHIRPYLMDAALLAGLSVVLLAPTASHAAMISQTISFDSIAPFGTFTNGSFTPGGWSSAFPINNIGSVDRFYLSFSSTDAAYVAQQGPLGGVPWIEFGYRDDVNARHAYASMGPGAEQLSFGIENPADFNLLKQLLADGELVVAPGGYERFADHSDDFTFGRSSTLTLSFELPDDDGSVPTNNVPEPTSALLVLAALAAAAAARQRRA